jgi:BR serine/threonine kinase
MEDEYKNGIVGFGYKYVKGFHKTSVIEAHHVESGENVAIKIIRRKGLLYSITKEKLEKEMSILRVLQKHQNIIELREVFQDDTNVYIVTELAPGGDLFRLMEKKKKLPQLEIFNYFSQVLDGVEYMHSKKIWHCFLNLEHLLIGKQGKIKLSKFTGAGMMSTNYIFNTLGGSLYYTAPEIVRENCSPHDGTLADCWSIGVVLYALSTGILPFFGSSNALFIEVYLKGKFLFPDNMDPILQDLISKILVKEPEKRYTIEKIRKHKWYVVNKKHYRYFVKEKQVKHRFDYLYAFCLKNGLYLF